MNHSAYETDLAYIHDTGYGQFARGAAPGLLTLLRDAAITGGRVVDLGCGSGIWGAELLRAGYEVTGVDISPGMVELARGRAPGAEFHLASFRQFQFPRCRAVTALGEVFN
jgi:2-polyprenyl-3-methyl-5-hydroxy-6-metoxy-1,4-benzoquinol methylase